MFISLAILDEPPGRSLRTAKFSRTTARNSTPLTLDAAKRDGTEWTSRFTAAMEESALKTATVTIPTRRKIGSTEMAQRKVNDHRLILKTIPVAFSSGKESEARAEGNNAAWACECGTLLVGRCYYQFGDTCFTECPNCQRTYRVTPDERKRAVAVVEAA